MEGPLHTKNENNTINGNPRDFSSNDEHNIDTVINGDSSSNVEPNVSIAINEDSSLGPHKAESDPYPREKVWCWVYFVLALVRIVVAIVVLIWSKDEHPQLVLRLWIIGYTCGCFLTLLIQFLYGVGSGTEGDKEDRETILGYVFLGWAALLLWIYINKSSSLYDGSQHFWLCMFFALTCIRHVPTTQYSVAWCSLILLAILVLWNSTYVLGINPNTFLLSLLSAALTLFDILLDCILKYLEKEA